LLASRVVSEVQAIRRGSGLLIEQVADGDRA